MVKVERVPAAEYENLFPRTLHVYNTVPFSRLNEHKVDSLHYLVFADSKTRMGIILGESADLLKSPFSAPFGGFSSHGGNVTVENVSEACETLKNYAGNLGLGIRITLPPVFYNHDFVSKQIYSLLNSGFKIAYSDINYHFDLSADIEKRMWRNGRKNTASSLRTPWDFHKAANDEEKLEAYEVIKTNRQLKGYPLKMSFQEVMNTTQIIDADFFCLRFQGKSVASAQVFRVTDEIVQVIYWGDDGEHSDMRPMNALAHYVTNYYKAISDVSYIDLGPSSLEGIPNNGLCNFKESIGCSASNKLTLIN